MAWPLNAVAVPLSCELPSNQQILTVVRVFASPLPTGYLALNATGFYSGFLKMIVLLSLAAVESYINNYLEFTLGLLCICNDWTPPRGSPYRWRWCVDTSNLVAHTAKIPRALVIFWAFMAYAYNFFSCSLCGSAELVFLVGFSLWLSEY